MQIETVRSIRFQEDFDTVAEAIADIDKRPGQEQAKRDTSRFGAASLVDASWSETDLLLELSNGEFLHVFIEGQTVRWTLSSSHTEHTYPRSIGTASTLFRSEQTGCEWVNDFSGLLGRRLGKRLKMLLVCDGLMLYFDQSLILWISPIQRTRDGAIILSVSETD